MVTQEQLNETVREIVEKEFRDRIEKRIDKWCDYSDKKVSDFDDIYNYINQYIIDGYPSDYIKLLDGTDELYFTLLDEYNYIIDNIKEMSFNHLKDVFDDKWYPNEYTTEWITEGITERFCKDSKDLYKNVYFSYCDSYSGALYLKTNGDDYSALIEDIDDYDDRLDVAYDEVENNVLEFDIDDLFNQYLIDKEFVDRYQVDLDELKKMKKEAVLKAIIYYKTTKREEIFNEITAIKKELKNSCGKIATELLENNKRNLEVELEQINNALANWDNLL